LAEIPAYSRSASKRQDRPVTPEVAGSSLVAPPYFSYKNPANQHIVLPVQALTTAGFLFILRTSRTGFPAESRPWPVIPASRTPGQGDRRSIMVSRKAPAHGRPRLDIERAASRLSWAAIDSASRRDLYS
jgi:hypothetical protein